MATTKGSAAADISLFMVPGADSQGRSRVGIIETIMAELRSASRSKPATKASILAALVSLVDSVDGKGAGKARETNMATTIDVQIGNEYLGERFARPENGGLGICREPSKQLGADGKPLMGYWLAAAPPAVLAAFSEKRAAREARKLAKKAAQGATVVAPVNAKAPKAGKGKGRKANA